MMNTLAPAGMVAPVTSPFDNNHADPWAKSFIDLPELNANVTDAIASAITQVRTAARSKEAELRTSSILVLGPAGAGKTHLFARLRQKLGPRAVFVHLRPLVGTEMTPRYVLGQIIQQLGYETVGQEGLKQLGAVVGSSLAQLAGASPNLPSVFVKDVEALDETKREEKLESAVEQLLERHQEADETYLARLLATPFMKTAQQRAALAWLAGRELEESQMKRLGVTANLSEDRIMQALQTLGLFAAPGAPIVLVFDQLENLMDAEATGARVRAYANLVAELFDATRGLILVQMALDSEWEHAILPQLSAAQKTRLTGQTTIISLPTPAQTRSLVARWVEHLPAHPEPFPWPFGERRVEHWARTPGMTPRMLMIACRQALALGPDAPFDEPEAPSTERVPVTADPANNEAALASAWATHVAKARAALDEAAHDRRSADPARVTGGIACALRFLKEVQTSRVDARQHIQVLVRVGADGCGVCLVHQAHPRSVVTAIERASEALAKGRVIVLRERALDFPPTWKRVQAATMDLVRRGARWITLERDDTANLLALESFLAAAKSRDLEDATGRVLEAAEVDAWIGRSLGIESWPLVRAVVTNDASDEASGIEIVPKGQSEREMPLAPPATDLGATIRTCLAQLRVASLERLVREVSRVTAGVSRADVVEMLDAMPSGARWFGRSLVAVEEGEDRS